MTQPEFYVPVTADKRGAVSFSRDDAARALSGLVVEAFNAGIHEQAFENWTVAYFAHEHRPVNRTDRFLIPIKLDQSTAQKAKALAERFKENNVHKPIERVIMAAVASTLK